MKWWAYLYLGIVTIVMIYLIYRYIDLSLKMRRQRRRYDLLLRGRGELNMEELLKAHSHDIDLSIKKLKALEANYSKVDDNIQGNKDYLDNKIMELTSNTSTSLIGRVDKQYGDLDKKLQDINSILDKKMDSINSILDKKIDANFSKINQDMNRINSDINNKINSLDGNMSQKIKSLDDKYNNRVNTVDAKFTNEVDKINTDRQTVYKKINERHEFDVSNLKKLDEENYNKLVDFINKQDKTIDDNLAFAIQHVSLHKYNALHNQSGDLSFTMVLLDRMKNGLMLTSINGRDASYTYSKEIVNGECLVDISPEEEKALNMLIKK